MNCPHEFLSVVTHPKVCDPASTYAQALAQIDARLGSPQAHVLRSGSQHWRILAELTRSAKPQGGQFHDARIAAFRIENGVSLLWSEAQRKSCIKTSDCYKNNSYLRPPIVRKTTKTLYFFLKNQSRMLAQRMELDLRPLLLDSAQGRAVIDQQRRRIDRV